MRNIIAVVLMSTWLFGCSAVQTVFPTVGNGQIDVPTVSPEGKLWLRQFLIRYAQESKPKALRLIEGAKSALTHVDTLDDFVQVSESGDAVEQYLLDAGHSPADAQLFSMLVSDYINSPNVSDEQANQLIRMRDFIRIVLESGELARDWHDSQN